MEQFVIDQISLGLRKIPTSFAKTFFMGKTSPEVLAVKAKAGGFVKGVCHPNENYEQIKAAGIGWIRIDIPFPFGEDGNLAEGYLAFKERCTGYKKNGVKVMAVTPYPRSFIDNGVDVRTDEKRLAEIAVFMINDLRDCIDGLQITNEMGLPHFTLPLTLDEAVRFIGVQAKAMYPVRGNIVIGYNSAGPQPDLHVKMKKYAAYYDYVGIDIYLGCFANVPGYFWVFGALLRYLWGLTAKPVFLQEFGYISGGAAKSKEEKIGILRRYGVESEKQAYENIEAFVSKLPERMCNHVRHVSPNPEHQGDFIFKSDFVNHLYCELPKITKIPGCPHTPEGQANFYKKLLPKLEKYDFLCGAFIYCYSDSKECYICSQSDCPTETRWGLVTVDGKEKPSYCAVRDAWKKSE